MAALVQAGYANANIWLAAVVAWRQVELLDSEDYLPSATKAGMYIITLTGRVLRSFTSEASALRVSRCSQDMTPWLACAVIHVLLSHAYTAAHLICHAACHVHHKCPHRSLFMVTFVNMMCFLLSRSHSMFPGLSVVSSEPVH